MVSALFTDHYELTMIEAALRDGTATKRAVFEAYYRSRPSEQESLAAMGLPGHGIMAGAARLVESVAGFSFSEAQIDFLRRRGFLSEATLDWLAGYRFGGDLLVTPDGERIDPGVPVVTVRGGFAETLLLETIVLSVLNSDATVATAAHRFRMVVGPAVTLIEMGSRRTHEEHAVAAAHAACIGGFDATSNLEAGLRHGVPTAGTAAHAWTLAHPGPDGEMQSFRTQITALGVDTTLLVDTYEISSGIRRAVEAAREFGAPGPGAIRIDSGDPAFESARARIMLDELGAERTRIVVSGDLDLPKVRALHDSGAPIDGYGIGTHLVANPPLGFIYKLVAIEGAAGNLVPVAKRSATASKATVGGEKTVVRAPDGAKVVGSSEDVRKLAIAAGTVMNDEHRSSDMAVGNKALIIVDLQEDFCEGGSLAVSGGNAVADRVAELLTTDPDGYDLIVTTRDWHSESTADHFPRNGDAPDYRTTWPHHCMAGTPGAAYHPSLRALLEDGTTAVEVLKGRTKAAYSGFEGVTAAGASLSTVLADHGIDQIDVCGLATDYCVRATTLDALAWLRTRGTPGTVRVLVDLVAAVAPETGAAALEEVRAAGAQLAESALPAAHTDGAALQGG